MRGGLGHRMRARHVPEHDGVEPEWAEAELCKGGGALEVTRRSEHPRLEIAQREQVVCRKRRRDGTVDARHHSLQSAERVRNLPRKALAKLHHARSHDRAVSSMQ